MKNTLDITVNVTIPLFKRQSEFFLDSLCKYDEDFNYFEIMEYYLKESGAIYSGIRLLEDKTYYTIDLLFSVSSIEDIYLLDKLVTNFNEWLIDVYDLEKVFKVYSKLRDRSNGNYDFDEELLNRYLRFTKFGD